MRIFLACLSSCCYVNISNQRYGHPCKIKWLGISEKLLTDVESPAIREAFHAVNKEYVLPSADSITRQVDKTYDEAVKVV